MPHGRWLITALDLLVIQAAGHKLRETAAFVPYVPGPEPTDPCGQTLTGDGSVTGEWSDGCDSAVDARGHARYYTFTLTQESQVTITLESDDADTYLYLREGEARSGAFLDDDDGSPDTTRSQIQETLTAGTCTIEATTYSTGETGSFTLTIAGLGTTAPAPEPEPSDPCGQTLTGDGSVGGQWVAGCESQQRDGSHARYYTFTLERQSEVTITLESSDADTYLYLRRGEDRSGPFLYENDDHQGSTSVSQVQATLGVGSSPSRPPPTMRGKRAVSP